MLRRANDLVARARERIRAAAEHDPHAWPERDDDRAILVYDDDVREFPDDDPQPVDLVDIPPDDDAGSTRPPLGSPEPGAPDLDGRVGPGGVSGPPAGGRPHLPGERSRRLTRSPGDPRRAETAVPNGLRIAAAWSWRLIVVLVAIYGLLTAMAHIAVVVVPRIRHPLRWLAVVAAVVMPLGVALSRIYRGMHHPTDFVGATLLTLMWVTLLWWVLRPNADVAEGNTARLGELGDDDARTGRSAAGRHDVRAGVRA